jgi:hypothetical protein
MIIRPSAEAIPGAIRVHPAETRPRGEWLRVSYRVEGLNAPELWFDIDAQFGDFFAGSSDAALAALLVAAMTAERPLHIEGPVSERLIWHMNNTVLPVVKVQIPFLPPTPVTIAEPRGQWDKGGDGILTGFSCGVDSLSVVQDHLLDDKVPEKERLTHLLFSHVGHHGYGPDVDEIAHQRGERVRRAADSLGLPLIRVYSNTPEFYSRQYDDRLNWIATLTIRNSSVPLLLQGGIRRFLFGSSHSWPSIGVFETTDMTKADPILLPALGTERTEICPAGTEYTRVEKTRRIAGMELARNHLDVCVMEGQGNCSRCEKCLRTLLTLEVLGALDSFRSRFDMEEYGKHREAFMARVLVETKNTFHVEIRDLMRSEGFPAPMKAKALAILLRAWRWIPETVRRRVLGRPQRSP